MTLAWGGIIRAPYVTEQGVVRDQPVPFSHEHHVAGLSIDCRYCHTSVETSSCRNSTKLLLELSQAGVGRHQCWSRFRQASAQSPIEWTRVNNFQISLLRSQHSRAQGSVCEPVTVGLIECLDVEGGVSANGMVSELPSISENYLRPRRFHDGLAASIPQQGGLQLKRSSR